MTKSNNEYKHEYAALIRNEYPSFPDDPLVFANWVFGDKDITDELWETKKSKLSHLVGSYGLQKYTQFSVLVAEGMTTQAALALVREDFLKQYRDWMETPEFLRRRALDAINHEKWLRRQHGRVGM